MSELKERRQALAKVREQLAELVVANASRIAVLRERQSALAQREGAAGEQLELRKRSFLAKWKLKLVPETLALELDGDAAKDWLEACQLVLDELGPAASRANKERLSGVLQDHYNASKHLLAEYVLEADISEAGRITIVSMRDRTRPQKPAALLLEMGALLAEQESLLSEKDRELFEEIILRSVGKAIRQRIQRAELWLRAMIDDSAAAQDFERRARGDAPRAREPGGSRMERDDSACAGGVRPASR